MNKNIFLICFLVLLISDYTFSKSLFTKKKLFVNQCCGCSGHGTCDSESCVCDAGYATNPTQVNGCWGYCGYKQKDILSIIFLQVFLGWSGATEFYLEKKVIGTCKLLLFLLTLLINPLFKCIIKRYCGSQVDDMGIGTRKCYYFPASLLGFLVLIIWSIDCFLYGVGYYHVDGNNIAIYFNN